MYLEIDEGFDEHPKTVRLCRVLGDVNAGQYLVRLWTWACRSAPDGDLSGMESGDLEAIMRYSPADGRLFVALTEQWSPKFGPWLDLEAGRMMLHGWRERQGAAIERMAKHAAVMRAARERKRAAQSNDVPVTCESRAKHVQTRQDTTSQDKSPDPPLLLASGSGARVATGGPIVPDTAHNLIHCLKVAMEAARPTRGMYSPGPFADRDAGELLRAIGGESSAPEVAKRIELFVTDDSMTPWTVARFCKAYNGIGAPKLQAPGQPKQAVYR